MNKHAKNLITLISIHNAFNNYSWILFEMQWKLKAHHIIRNMTDNQNTSIRTRNRIKSSIWTSGPEKAYNWYTTKKIILYKPLYFNYVRSRKNPVGNRDCRQKNPMLGKECDRRKNNPPYYGGKNSAIPNQVYPERSNANDPDRSRTKESSMDIALLWAS